MTSDQGVDHTGTRDSDPEPLLDVWLLRYPLRLGVRASEHYESVFREFALLATAEPGPSVPGRMIALIEELGRRYARNNAHEQERDAALARGEEVLDIAHAGAGVGRTGRVVAWQGCSTRPTTSAGRESAHLGARRGRRGLPSLVRRPSSTAGRRRAAAAVAG